jgi:ubiquinone biosynthesis protein
MALEDLGPTFVKLGQVMATRVDLLPPAWIAELEKAP